MKLSVVGLDDDGIISEGGALDPDARAALSDARERGIVVIVVPGRILDAPAPSHAVQLALNAAGVPFQTGHRVLETGAKHKPL